MTILGTGLSYCSGVQSSFTLVRTLHAKYSCGTKIPGQKADNATAIIVACLISFRALFTRSERLHSSSGGPLSSPTKPYYHRHWYHSRGQNSDSGSLNAQRRNTISREPDDPYPLEDLPNGVYVRREFGVRNEKDAV